MGLTKRHKEWLGAESVRGYYRFGGACQGLWDQNLKVGNKMRCRLGGVTALVVAICGPRHYLYTFEVPKGRWSGKRAIEFYQGLYDFCKKKYPDFDKSWTLLEDNDPSLKGKKVGEVKAALGLNPIGLPPRSPDLSPLDYGVWSHICAKMRSQEKGKYKKNETVKEWKTRLKKCVGSTSKTFLKKVMKSMKKRLVCCKNAKGGHFEV